MESGKANQIVGVTMVLTLAVGTVNSVAKEESLPSARFVIGSGIVWLVLSGIAEIEPEIAAPLAVAILTTSLFSKDPGVLSFLNKRGETGAVTPDNTAKAKKATPKPVRAVPLSAVSNPQAIS